MIVELYDKPTLMVKVCPVFRQDAGICVLHERSPRSCRLHFFRFPLSFSRLWKSSGNDYQVFPRFFNLAPKVCLPRPRQTRLLPLSPWFLPRVLPIFLSLHVSSCLDLTYDDGSVFPLVRQIVQFSPCDSYTICATSPWRADTA